MERSGRVQASYQARDCRSYQSEDEIMSESRTPQPVKVFDKDAPIMRRVNTDFPGDGKPRFAFFGMVETDEQFAQRAGAQIQEVEE